MNLTKDDDSDIERLLTKKAKDTASQEASSDIIPPRPRPRPAITSPSLPYRPSSHSPTKLMRTIESIANQAKARKDKEAAKRKTVANVPDDIHINIMAPTPQERRGPSAKDQKAQSF